MLAGQEATAGGSHLQGDLIPDGCRAQHPAGGEAEVRVPELVDAAAGGGPRARLPELVETVRAGRVHADAEVIPKQARHLAQETVTTVTLGTYPSR